jgi:uncharacterized Zn-finger protein
MKVNVRVEYEPIQIRHIAVQCPECKKWFRGNDISDGWLGYEHEIHFAQFTCPVCGKVFGYNSHRDSYNRDCSDEISIVEMGHPKIYKDVLQKKETWE